MVGAKIQTIHLNTVHFRKKCLRYFTLMILFNNTILKRSGSQQQWLSQQTTPPSRQIPDSIDLHYILLNLTTINVCMSPLYFFNVFKKEYLFRSFLILYTHYWEGGNTKTDWFPILCNTASVSNMAINLTHPKWPPAYFMDGANFLIS